MGSPTTSTINFLHCYTYSSLLLPKIELIWPFNKHVQYFSCSLCSSIDSFTLWEIKLRNSFTADLWLHCFSEIVRFHQTLRKLTFVALNILFIWFWVSLKLPSTVLLGIFKGVLLVMLADKFWWGTRWCENKGFAYLY